MRTTGRDKQLEYHEDKLSLTDSMVANNPTMDERVINMKKSIMLLISILATLLCVTALADIDIDSTFPDQNFRDYIKSEFDQDGDGKLSDEDIKGITEISCEGKSIESLKGIECLYNLASLDCSSNLLTNLDTRHNTALDHLYCSNNQLTELDLSKNIRLEYLSCSMNKLSSININNNTALETLYCYYNNLKKLDVTNNSILETLDCGSNKLTSLNITNNTMLEDLSCSDNKLTQIDISSNPFLKHFGCGYNSLTTIDISKNTFLESLNCNNNPITHLDLHSSTLNSLSCIDNKIKQLDLSDCSILSETVRNYERDRTGSYDVIGEYAICIDRMTTIIAGDFISEGITEKSISIKLSKKKLTITGGKTQTITAKFGNRYDAISYVYSNNTKVAKVKYKGNEILITPTKKAGTATISVTTNMGAKANISVTVKNGAALNEKSITLKPKKTFKIKVLSIPATIKAKSFESDKPSVATVDRKGKIKALSKGTATITVTLTNGKKLKLKVKVK